MKIEPRYPTAEHEQAVKAVTGFFSSAAGVEAILLICSCARGKASRESCVDIAVLVNPEMPSKQRASLEQEWNDYYESAPAFKALLQVGKYTHVDLDLIDGCFVPKPRSWTSGPDEFELELGNYVAYSHPLWQSGDRLEQLKNQWLPYYDQELRRERLAMARNYCLNNLDHIPSYVDRGLHFQAFHRLYDAFREFLQALFIYRRTYPIAYNKWIREQVEEILGMPELYRQLPRLFEIQRFESQEITSKADELAGLLEHYVEEMP